MVQLAIRCHPRALASADDSIVRLSRLTRGRGAGLDVGWMIELELDGEALAEGPLADVLRDMRLLGLQPTLLTPRGAATNGRAA
jgi:hypothetical protein